MTRNLAHFSIISFNQKDSIMTASYHEIPLGVAQDHVLGIEFSIYFFSNFWGSGISSSIPIIFLA